MHSGGQRFLALMALLFVPAAKPFGIAPIHLPGHSLSPVPRDATALASFAKFGPPLTRATQSRGVLRMGAGDEDGEQSGRKRRQLAAVLGSVLLASTQFGHLAHVIATQTTQSALTQTISSSAGSAVAAQAGKAAATAPASTYTQTLRYSDFLNAVEANRVKQVTFSPDCRRLIATVDGKTLKLEAVPEDPTLVDTLTAHDVDIIVMARPREDARSIAVKSTVLFSLFFFFNGLALMWSGFDGDTKGKGGGLFGGGGDGKMKKASEENRVTFEHVAGLDGAKEELQEIVHFLKEPERYTQLGARIPRGVILDGPPGTGKTLLARAVAGEAGVPFFSMAGSEFVEMYAGLGAARVRELFAQAKEVAPCIVFIDEIDAVGRKRNEPGAGGSDERHNTLNQLLVEMDGFQGNSGIIAMAATNRADILDAALLRPGRFDRRITVGHPDFSGRLAILGVHARGKPLKDVDLSHIARRTPGFSGASLSNLMNEATIFAARANQSSIGASHISDALDRISFGPMKKSQETFEHRQRIVAVHEAGHALIAALLPDFDQVAKITITPRGGAGGLTVMAPEESRVDSGLYSRAFLESQMMVALGGRIAEELQFGPEEVTTGASNDLEKVTATARAMVTEFGMSEKLGNTIYPQGVPVSKATSKLIDAEVGSLVKTAYARAKQLILDNQTVLTSIAQRLVEKETVTAEELEELLMESHLEINAWRDESLKDYGP